MGLTITAHRKFAGGVSYHSRRRISCAASQREAEHGVSWLEAVRWAPPSPLHLRCTSGTFPTHPTGRCMTVRIKPPKFQQITNKRNQQTSRCDHDGSDATCARSRDDVPGSLRYSGVDLSWGVVIANHRGHAAIQEVGPPHIAAMNKTPGVARGFACRLERVPLLPLDRVRRRALDSFAWSHFLRKTGSPLFRKMLRCCNGSDQKSRPSKSRRRSRRTFGSGSAPR